MNLFYILYIYIYYMWKNWNKGCIFYFFKFSRMLCWRKKKDEIFSGRLMMIIMPIITDLLKKMVVFFLITLFHVNVHYFHYHIVIKRRNILTNQSTYSCIFVLQESASRRLDLNWLYCYNKKKKMICYDWSKHSFI